MAGPTGPVNGCGAGCACALHEAKFSEALRETSDTQMAGLLADAAALDFGFDETPTSVVSHAEHVSKDTVVASPQAETHVSMVTSIGRSESGIPVQPHSAPSSLSSNVTFAQTNFQQSNDVNNAATQSNSTSTPQFAPQHVTTRSEASNTEASGFQTSGMAFTARAAEPNGVVAHSVTPTPQYNLSYNTPQFTTVSATRTTTLSSQEQSHGTRIGNDVSATIFGERSPQLQAPTITASHYTPSLAQTSLTAERIQTSPQSIQYNSRIGSLDKNSTVLRPVDTTLQSTRTIEARRVTVRSADEFSEKQMDRHVTRNEQSNWSNRSAQNERTTSASINAEVSRSTSQTRVLDRNNPLKEFLPDSREQTRAQGNPRDLHGHRRQEISVTSDTSVSTSRTRLVESQSAPIAVREQIAHKDQKGFSELSNRSQVERTAAINDPRASSTMGQSERRQSYTQTIVRAEQVTSKQRGEYQPPRHAKELREHAPQRSTGSVTESKPQTEYRPRLERAFSAEPATKATRLVSNETRFSTTARSLEQPPTIREARTFSRSEGTTNRTSLDHTTVRASKELSKALHTTSRIERSGRVTENSLHARHLKTLTRVEGLLATIASSRNRRPETRLVQLEIAVRMMELLDSEEFFEEPRIRGKRPRTLLLRRRKSRKSERSSIENELASKERSRKKEKRGEEVRKGVEISGAQAGTALAGKKQPLQKTVSAKDTGPAKSLDIFQAKADDGPPNDDLDPTFSLVST